MQSLNDLKSFIAVCDERGNRLPTVEEMHQCIDTLRNLSLSVESEVETLLHEHKRLRSIMRKLAGDEAWQQQLLDEGEL